MADGAGGQAPGDPEQAVIQALWQRALTIERLAGLLHDSTEAAAHLLDRLAAAGVPLAWAEHEHARFVYIPIRAGSRQAGLRGRRSCAVRGCQLPQQGSIHCILHRRERRRVEVNPPKSERWKPLPEDKLYEVSDFGRVRSWKFRGRRRRTQPRLLTVSLDRNGVAVVSLHIAGVGRVQTLSVARLVLRAFGGEVPDDGSPGRRIAFHLDGDTANNRLRNLEWRAQRGEDHPRAVLKEVDVRDILAMDEDFASVQEIADALDLPEWTVSDVVEGRNWRHVLTSSRHGPSEVPE